MYQKLSNQMAQYLIKNGVGKREYIDVYAYGFESIISTTMNTIILVGLGFIFGWCEEILIYIIFFAGLRKHAGGMHRNTHLSCILTYGMIAFLHIQILKKLFQYNEQIVMHICLIYFVLVIILIFKYAPVDSANKRLSQEEKSIQRLKCIQNLIIEIGIIIGMMIFRQRWLAVVAMAALVTESMMLLPILNNYK